MANSGETKEKPKAPKYQPYVDLILAFVGGFLGTLARYGISKAIDSDDPHTDFMIGTWVVNVLGCFIGGFLMPFSKLDGWYHYGLSFLSTGFCGALTTFGGYTYSMMLKLEKPSKAELGVAEFVAMVLGCIVLVILGYFISANCVLPHIDKKKQEEKQDQNQSQPQPPNRIHEGPSYEEPYMVSISPECNNENL